MWWRSIDTAAISRAAATMGLSQSALSRSVQTLEADLEATVTQGFTRCRTHLSQPPMPKAHTPPLG
ncbi:LysR family transcriptional regulator [Brevundimonas diminuta]|uniref:LysR family transcriptional regulator n=1 Tax=Brevundimonas diminuta TaxID=293 RepID=UPI000ECF042D|nr:hypothetical protein [Brevundimonas sp.]